MSDFGEGRWVVGNRRHRCAACMGPIPLKERHYHYRGMYGGDWQNWRMHVECYETYAQDNFEEFTGGDFPVPDRIAPLTAAADTNRRKS